MRALDGLDRLSARLAAQKDDIATAIEDLGPGLKVLADQREQLTTMLTALSELGKVGTRVINASQGRHGREPASALEPILTQLAKAGDDLPNALEMLVTYPFPQAATGAVKGDYTNLRITADLDLRTILTNLNGGKDPGAADPAAGCRPPAPARPCRLPTVPDSRRPAAAGLPSLPVTPRPAPTAPGGGGGGGGPVCVPGVVCLNNASSPHRLPAARTTPTWPRLMLRGLAMIRRGVKVQLVAFLLITVVGVSYVSARYIGLGDLLLGGGYVVTADFAESGGIFADAEVTYRGVPVGRVDRLRLADDGVHVDLRIDSGVEVPADTLAVVANRSAVGEQYVDLQPRTQDGPYLADGDRIDERRDTAPRCTPRTLLLNLDRLVNSVDKRDLVVVIDELGKAFAGTGPDLQRLLDSGDALTRSAVDALPETISPDRGRRRRCSTTQRESGLGDQELLRPTWPTSATPCAPATATCARCSDGGIVGLAGAATRCSGTTGPAISALLANLLTSGQVTVARLDGLEQVLVTYPDNVAGGYTVVPGDGTSHFGLVLNASDPPACTQGYGGTTKRTPSDTSDAPGQHRRPVHRCRAAARRRCAAPRTPRRLRPVGQDRPGGAGRHATGRTVTSRAGPFRRRTSPGTTPPAAWPSAPADPRW